MTTKIHKNSINKEREKKEEKKSKQEHNFYFERIMCI